MISIDFIEFRTRHRVFGGDRIEGFKYNLKNRKEMASGGSRSIFGYSFIITRHTCIVYSWQSSIHGG